MKKIFENFIKKAKKANKYEDKNIDVYPSSGFVIKNENNEWIKNRTNIKKEIEEQKSSVKTVNFSTQIEKNKNSKVEKMKICPHCGFVFEDDKNYWLINRTELLVKIAEQKAIKEANHLKDAMDKEKAMLEEEIKTIEKRRNTPDNKTVAQAVGRAIFKEVENQEKIKTPQEIGLELQTLHSAINFSIDKKSNND